MCPDMHTLAANTVETAPGRQRGLGLISAIALILLVATIAAALAQLVQRNAATDQTALMRVRALAAAESGLEIALNRVYAPAGTGSCANRNWTFSLEGLRGCSAVTSCTTTVVAAQTYYDISSRATCTAGDASSSREMRTRAMAP